MILQEIEKNDPGHTSQKDFFLPYIHQFVSSWASLVAEDLIILNTVGITNKTYIVKQTKYPIVQPEQIIFRHYGQTCQGTYIDRNKELQIVSQLAKMGMGPQYYGAAEKVRLEEYLIDNRVLQQSEMKDKYFSRKVAIYLARFHKIDMQEILDKVPLPLQVLDVNGKILSAVRIKLSQRELFPQHEQVILDQLEDWFSDSEIQFIKQRLPTSERSVCFSHNDLLANNVLLCQPNDKVFFIDFEYSSYNYRGFDIGNYFAESQFDYNNPNPPYYFLEEGHIDETIVQDFIQVYTLTQMGYIITDDQVNDIASNDDLIQKIISNLSPIKFLEFKQTVDEIMFEFQISSMLSHFYWGGWGIYMGHSANTNFDYITFAQSRYKKYLALKKRMLESNNETLEN